MPRRMTNSASPGQVRSGAAEADPPVANLSQQTSVPLDSLPDAALLADAEGRVISVNREFLKIFGKPIESVVGLPIEHLMPERFRSRHARFAGRFATEPKQRPMGAGLDLIALRGDGAEFPVEISLSPIDAPAGRMILAVIKDITMRRRVEIGLRESEQQYRELVENSPDMVWQLDKDWRFEFVSGGMLRLLGYRRDELLGRSVRAVLTPESLETIRQGVRAREILENEGIVTDVKSYEIDLVRKNANIVSVELRKSA